MSNMNDMGSLRTPICDLLGCRYPVIQTAMGYVAGADLVIGTTNAGGFGFLAGATIPADSAPSAALPPAMTAMLSAAERSMLPEARDSRCTASPRAS